MRNRVVITGLGLVTPIGIGRDAFWTSLKNGANGIGAVTRFDPSSLTTKIAAEVRDFDALNFMDRKSARHMDRFSQMAVAAAELALQDARFETGNIDPERIGVYVGSGIGGIETYEQQSKIMADRGPSRISPFFIPMLIGNMAGSQVAIRWGLKGPNMCFVSACASSTNAVGEAFRVLQKGEADVMLAGGSEASITPLSFAGFCAMKAMSTNNESPETASRPFDRDRDGFVMGEGAGILIMETLPHAVRRGAPILAEMGGYGTNCDAFHVVQPAPDGLGAAAAMATAIGDADMEPEAIDYINAHGTSTDMNDRLETKAIKDVFSQHARNLAVSSTKSMTGHLLGASGAVELAAAVLAIINQWLPPTINLENPDPECDLDYVPRQGRPAVIGAALSNSFGFGGHNASLVVRQWRN